MRAQQLRSATQNLRIPREKGEGETLGEIGGWKECALLLRAGSRAIVLINRTSFRSVSLFFLRLSDDDNTFNIPERLTILYCIVEDARKNFLIRLVYILELEICTI